MLEINIIVNNTVHSKENMLNLCQLVYMFSVKHLGCVLTVLKGKYIIKVCEVLEMGKKRVNK